MRRWIGKIAVAVSLLLLAAAVVMWVNSYRELDDLRLHRVRYRMISEDVAESREWYVHLRSSNGKLAVLSTWNVGQRKESRDHIRKAYDGKTRMGYLWNDNQPGIRHEPEWMSMPTYYHNQVKGLGFEYGRFERNGPIYGTAAGPIGLSRTKLLILPWWAVAGVFAVAPLWWGSRNARKRWRRATRLRRGLCTECGYDLSASKGVCPECGTNR